MMPDWIRIAGVFIIAASGLYAAYGLPKTIRELIELYKEGPKWED